MHLSVMTDNQLPLCNAFFWLAVASGVAANTSIRLYTQIPRQKAGADCLQISPRPKVRECRARTRFQLAH